MSSGACQTLEVHNARHSQCNIEKGSALIFTRRRTWNETGSTRLAQIFGYEFYDVLVNVFIHGYAVLFGTRGNMWNVLVTLLVCDRSPLPVTQCTESLFNILRDPKLYQKDKRALPGNLQTGKRFRFPRDDDDKWTLMLICGCHHFRRQECDQEAGNSLKY